MPSAVEVRRALARIVASAAFRDSYRLRSFLTFVVKATLAGSAERIKAYTIAVEALGRSSDFDPQTDPIVRVEAGRLRHALARYYGGGGRNDPITIEMPRGSYVPVFHRRDAGARFASSRAAQTSAAAEGGAAEAVSMVLGYLGELCRIIPTLVAPATATAAQPVGNERRGKDAGAFIGANSDIAANDGRNGRVANRADSHTATAFKLIAMLDQLSAQLLAVADLNDAAQTILDATVRLHQSDFGNVQLLDQGSHELVIAAQRGFNERFLHAFARVSADSGCACGTALRRRSAIIVRDVLDDADFAPFREVAAAAGFRAVQSTPLIGGGGKLVGVVSTHFSRPHIPSPLDMLMTQFYGRLAADAIERLSGRERAAPAGRTGPAA